MHPCLVKPLDWISIRFCAHSVHRGRHDIAALNQAESLLNQPDFFDCAVGAPPTLVFRNKHEFVFDSPRPSPWAENNLVWGRLYRCDDDPWAGRGTVIMLHGWNAELGYELAFPKLARQLNRAGINAAMIEMPYHGRRKPRQRDAARNFLSDDLAHILRGTQQALADARALLSWLEQQGCWHLGLWGISLGAWFSGLVACHDPRVRFAVLSTPVPRIDRLVAESLFCEPIRRVLQNRPVSLSSLNLVSHQPLISPRSILIVESVHDLFAPLDTVEELWERWGRTDILRTRHGHISAMMSPMVTTRTLGWLTQRGAVEPLSARHDPRYCQPDVI